MVSTICPTWLRFRPKQSQQQDVFPLSGLSFYQNRFQQFSTHDPKMRFWTFWRIWKVFLRYSEIILFPCSTSNMQSRSGCILALSAIGAALQAMFVRICFGAAWYNFSSFKRCSSGGWWFMISHHFNACGGISLHDLVPNTLENSLDWPDGKWPAKSGLSILVLGPDSDDSDAYRDLWFPTSVPILSQPAH